MNKLILSFVQVSQKDVDLCGGKASSLGELVKIGMPAPEGFVVMPDTILVDKNSLKIINYKIGKQKKMVIRKGTIGVPKEKQKQRKLSEGKVIELAKFCLKIENHFGRSQDIEWALVKNKLYILQSRPVTVL